MLKMIIALVATGAILIATGTTWLVALNWNEKLYGPLLSIAVGGAVTALIAVVVLLKEEQMRDTFAVSVPFDSRTNNLPFIVPDKENFSVTLRLSEIAGLALAEKTPASNAQSTEQVLRDEEVFRYCGELLQYQIVRSLHRLQSGGWVSMQLGTEASAQIRNPALLSRTSQYQGDRLLQALSKNRFAQSDSERFLWQHGRLRLPENTKMTLDYTASSPDAGRERHTVRLVKSGFFDLSFAVIPIGATGPGVLPVGLKLPDDQKSHVRTFQYEVQMLAHFHKLTAGNWQTDELKAWAKWLFSEMKKSLADGSA